VSPIAHNQPPQPHTAGSIAASPVVLVNSYPPRSGSPANTLPADLVWKVHVTGQPSLKRLRQRLTITIRSGTGWARIEVSDIGTGEWHPQPGDGEPGAEYGRGLAIIGAVADNVGHDVQSDGQTLWAEVAWPDTDQA